MSLTTKHNVMIHYLQKGTQCSTVDIYQEFCSPKFNKVKI